MKQVTIWIEGGVIQNMNVPEGVTVVTYDFDIDGAPEDELSYYDGEPCFMSVWAHARERKRRLIDE